MERNERDKRVKHKKIEIKVVKTHFISIISFQTKKNKNQLTYRSVDYMSIVACTATARY